MITKRCIKCGTVEEYHDADTRCRHCKGGLVLSRAKGPDELTKLAWKACDRCFKTGYYACDRTVACGTYLAPDSDNSCDVWRRLTE